MIDPILAAAGGGAAVYIVQLVLKKTIGTQHVTVKECENCETKQAVGNIQDLCVELAIKAGVPVQVALKAVKGRRSNSG